MFQFPADYRYGTNNNLRPSKGDRESNAMEAYLNLTCKNKYVASLSLNITALGRIA